MTLIDIKSMIVGCSILLAVGGRLFIRIRLLFSCLCHVCIRLDFTMIIFFTRLAHY